MAIEFNSPYASVLQLTHRHDGNRRIVTMPFFDGTLGRPGFLHGGAIAGLLEYAAWTTLLDALEADPARIKPINISVDFMRGGQMVDSYASAVIVRLGRRIANVVATAWQDDEAKPIATANLKLMLERSA
jgi:uncharacterized protein (TIGR00369 family)